MLTDFGRVIVTVILAILTGLFAVFLGAQCDAEAKEDPLRPWVRGEYDHERYNTEEIGQAITWLVEKVHKHRWRRDPAWQTEVTTAYHESGEEWGYPQLLLTAMGYRESNMKTTVVGSAGEQGLQQVGKYCRNHKRCKASCGDMSTVRQQIDCGSCCLRITQKWCGGSLLRGVNGYISGKCDAWKCKNPRRVETAVRVRFKLWKITHDLVRPGEPVPDLVASRGSRAHPLFVHSFW